MNWYKRMVFWQLRVMSHIPGLKRYSRWLTHHYERHFWRAWAVNYVTAVVPYLGLMWWIRRQEQRLQAEMQPRFLDDYYESDEAHEPSYS